MYLKYYFLMHMSFFSPTLEAFLWLNACAGEISNQIYISKYSLPLAFCQESHFNPNTMQLEIYYCILCITAPGMQLITNCFLSGICNISSCKRLCQNS